MPQQYPFDTIDYLSDVEVERKLLRIKRANLRKVNFESLKRSIMAVSKGLVLEAPRYKPSFTLFRARVLSARPETVDVLAHPPANKVKNFGRANRPRRSIFYLNTLREAVFFEVSPRVGDFLAIGHWAVTQSLMMFPVGYSDAVFRMKKSNRNRPLFGDGNHPRLCHPTNKKLEAFFAKEFVKEVAPHTPWKFKISAAIAENRLSLPEADGIMYPTVAMRANSDNFALKPESASKLQLTKAEYVRIDEVHGFSYDVTVLDTATEFPEGSIQWKGKPKWVLKQGEQVKIVVENGRYRAYDLHGNLREYD